MKDYTIKEFYKNFPNDDACLEYLFKSRFGDDYTCPKCNKKGFYRVKGRKAYACGSCGYQVYPTSKTVFYKSSTSLTDWFFAFYLMSKSNNNISAKELQRHLGCTYKTAWRIREKIKKLG